MLVHNTNITSKLLLAMAYFLKFLSSITTYVDSKFRRAYENIGHGYCMFILLQGRHELFPDVNLRSTRFAGCTSKNLHNSCDIKLPV